MRDLVWSFKFSLRELIHQKKIYLFLILNLFIGTFGFLAVQIFQSSLQVDLSERAQTMLGADFSISANRQFKPEEVQEFEKSISYDQKTTVVEFFGMLKSKDKSRLVTVRAFEEKYPFYGDIGSEKSLLDPQSETAWVDPELLKMLNVDTQAVGLQLGKLALKSVDVISKDSSRFFRGTGFAPVIYISKKLLPATELVEEGSTSKTFLLYKLNNLARLKEIQTEFFKNIKDTSIKFETAQDRSESGNTAFKYFTDYLGLVAIVSISLCFLSGGYLMRWAFQQQRKNIGIYKALGMSDIKIQWIYVLQVLFTSIFAFILSLALFLVLKPGLNYYFVHNSLPFQLNLTFTSILICLGISIIAPLFMFMPINSSIAKLNPKDLFLGQTASDKTSASVYLWYAVCVLG
ncbi:MAG: FtsX-like permease family protein, partial [Bdellovibrionaceae bacterium]|nr:FtsX-like permease family protein [Pseudobdellovibrionaceae bacterium]